MLPVFLHAVAAKHEGKPKPVLLVGGVSIKTTCGHVLLSVSMVFA